MPPDPSSLECKTLLSESADMLLALLDPWTGLPYDHVACGGTGAPGATGVNPRWGVVPQLKDAPISKFSQDPGQTEQSVDWRFSDRGPRGEVPALLYALRLELHLSPGNVFGGITWGAAVDIRRYRRMCIRYASSDPNWELKLNFGPGVEPRVLLQGTAGAWAEPCFAIPGDFPGADPEHLKHITLATSEELAGTNPILWVDQIAFEADPAQTARCDAFCPKPLPLDPDLACYEPFTGAVNVANALAALSLLAEAGVIDGADAHDRVERIIQTAGSFPVRSAEGKWFQDWHSAASGMPRPYAPPPPPPQPPEYPSVASMTDQPQLYAALMVVEQRWPDLAARAAALRAKMDFSLLVEPANPCCLRWAVDRCAGVVSGCLEYIGRDTLLGSFLAVATGQVHACHWRSLAAVGCAHDGPAEAPWFTTGPPCQGNPIPATGTGGPFLQLAALLYLTAGRIPWGPLALDQSAGNMLRAQAAFADANNLPLAGWSNASDPDDCPYLTCEQFTPAKVTPYVWAMGRDIAPAEAELYVQAFHGAGVDSPLDTGTLLHPFGFRDAWNQVAGTGRDAYLYLDTGWSVLGLLNHCKEGLVRQRFAAHPVAENGYSLLGTGRALCQPTSGTFLPQAGKNRRPAR